MGSLRLVLRAANQTVILQHRQQFCNRMLLQNQRLFGNQPYGLTTTATCTFIKNGKYPRQNQIRNWTNDNQLMMMTTTMTSTTIVGSTQHIRCYSLWNCKSDDEKLLRNRCILANGLTEDIIANQKRRRCFSNNKKDAAKKTETTASPAATPDACLFDETANLGLFAKFKLMYKKYWYVLLPVHIITSIGWFGSFYYMSKSGVDVPSLLQYLNISQSIIDKVQHSNMGHYAIAYLCYKIATPLRYAVTLGGTTVSIKVLAQAGHIKPIPTKTELIAMYEKKKEGLQARFENKAK